MSDLNQTNRPRALFVCSTLPYPATFGTDLRQATQIEALALDYDVTVAVKFTPALNPAELPEGIKVRVDPGTPRSLIPVDASRRQAQLDNLLGTLPLSKGFKLYLSLPRSIPDPIMPKRQNIRRPHYLACLQVDHFDLVWVSRLETAWAIGPVGPIPSVLDMDDLESSVYQGKQVLREGVFAVDAVRVAQKVSAISRVERELSLGYSLVTLSAGQEAEKIDLPNVRILQNCAPPGVSRCSSQTGDAERILFIGTLEYLPNLHGMYWFLEKVWPQLLSGRPSASLDVIGKCFNANHNPNLILPPNVRLHGFVEDTAAFWEEAALLIVPIFAGGGTRIKILEAWSRGLPVVTTSLGVAGLEAVDGVHALIADTPEAFARKCETLLASPALRAALVSAGKALAGSKYSRETAVASVRRIAQEARHTARAPVG